MEHQPQEECLQVVRREVRGGRRHEQGGGQGDRSPLERFLGNALVEMRFASDFDGATHDGFFEFAGSPRSGFGTLELQGRHQVGVETHLLFDQQCQFEFRFAVTQPRGYVATPCPDAHAR